MWRAGPQAHASGFGIRSGPHNGLVLAHFLTEEKKKAYNNPTPLLLFPKLNPSCCHLLTLSLLWLIFPLHGNGTRRRCRRAAAGDPAGADGVSCSLVERLGSASLQGSRSSSSCSSSSFFSSSFSFQARQLPQHALPRGPRRRVRRAGHHCGESILFCFFCHFPARP